MRFLRTTLTFVAVWCAFASAVRAQDAFDAPPPHLSLVEGTATLDREDVTEPATEGMVMVPGDRLRTERGRAELLFPDGSAIDLDEYTTFELEGPTLVRMTNGRLLVFAAGANNPSSAVQFQIDTPMASAQTDGPGEYRVSILGGTQTEMAIARGAGALVNELGTMPLRSGELSVAWDNVAPSRPQFFNSARFDAFDQWAMALRDQRLGSRAQSAQYLPADLRMYGGALDRYGAWNYEAPYGYVWYPTVAPDWRPYYDGYWSSVPTYGWTWIGANAWSWPTHHYGRWGYASSRWFWIPDRRWAPAWVSWGGAPGYVSWCPLGFDNRPVFSLASSGSGYRGWNGWNGWTVVSHDHFGGHRSVRQFAVGPRALPANVGFVQQASVPVAPPRAVPRPGGNAGQVAGGQRQFPTVIGRTSAAGQDVAVSRRGADRPAEGQVTREGRPTTITRSPQAVGRQPQTNGQTQSFAQPAPPEAGGFRDRPQAVSRQPQVPATPSTPRAVPPSYDGQNRGFYRTRPPDAAIVTPAAPNENRTNSARPRYERPTVPQAPAQPIVPATPQRSERSQSGTAMPRSAPIQPAQPVQPNNAQPGFSRRAGGPFYTERPTAPPAVSTPPPQVPQRQPAPAREERASPPPQERQNDQARSRGRENQQSSGSEGQQNGGGGGRHRR